jgi:hypothetical protein
MDLKRGIERAVEIVCELNSANRLKISWISGRLHLG